MVSRLRRRRRAGTQADARRVGGHLVGVYLDALSSGDVGALRNSWPGEVVVYDPRAGEVRGHRRLRQFIHRNQVWLAERRARTERVAATCVNGRAVVELLAHLTDGGRETVWPVAVVAESPDDRSVVFRTYCSQLPVDDRRHIRPPILPPTDAQAETSSASTSPRCKPVTPTRSWAPSPRRGMSASPSKRTCTAAPTSCARTSIGASAPGAASTCSTARSPTTARAACSSTTASSGAVTRWHPRPGWRLRAEPRRPAGRGPPLRRHRSTRALTKPHALRLAVAAASATRTARRASAAASGSAPAVRTTRVPS